MNPENIKNIENPKDKENKENKDNKENISIKSKPSIHFILPWRCKYCFQAGYVHM